MTPIRSIVESLQSHLENKLGGTWNGRPLRVFNFFSQGSTGGIRIESGTNENPDKGITTRRFVVGRVFPIVDDDHLEANILAVELAETMQATIDSWSRCAQVRLVGNFRTDCVKAPLNEVCFEPRPTDRDVTTTTTRSPIVTPAEVTAAYAYVSIVFFDVSY